jgi:hypothetical protein
MTQGARVALALLFAALAGACALDPNGTRQAEGAASGGTSAGGAGGVPAAGGAGGEGGGCTVSDEICNGLDDNCDGQVDEGAGCPCEHRLLGDHAYLFCPDLASWSTARDKCKESQYDIVTINSADENGWIYDVGKELGLSQWFIGFTDEDAEGEWVLVDGSRATYINWNPAEPNGGSNTNCGAMGYYGDGTWDDFTCDQMLAYVCEAGPE